MSPSPDKKGFEVPMTKSEVAIVDELATQRGFKSRAQYIRSLIEKDAQELGVEVRFEHNWGGNRKG
jgi:hypothetical protein